MAKLIKDFAINFTQVPNQVIRDERLSWKAKGLYAHLISKPDNWTFYIDEMVRSSKDGKSSVQSGLKELEKYGYLRRVKSKDAKGKFAGWDYLIRINPG